MLKIFHISKTTQRIFFKIICIETTQTQISHAYVNPFFFSFRRNNVSGEKTTPNFLLSIIWLQNYSTI